jgi:hypothetical protein
MFITVIASKKRGNPQKKIDCHAEAARNDGNCEITLPILTIYHLSLIFYASKQKNLFTYTTVAYTFSFWLQ